MPGAAHYHEYQSTTNKENAITVFCTQFKKRFLYSAPPELEFEICFKVSKKITCEKMHYKYDALQDAMIYEYVLKISDRKFHKTVKNDSIRLISKSTNEEFFYVLVE